MLSRLVLIVVFALGMIQGGALAGPVVGNDGSFGYQGYLEFGGAPANGDFYFRFSMFDSAVGGSEVSPLYGLVGPVTATDGLFVCNIQLGGTQEDALGFWKEFGDAVKYLNIEVGQIEGSYTTLSNRVFIGSTPQALHSQFARALTFPYADSYSNTIGDPDTMVSLNSVFGGPVMDLSVGTESNFPTLRVRGSNPSDDFVLSGQYGGAVQINSMDEQVGLLSVSAGFPLLGYHVSEFFGNRAAVLGEVDFNASPNIIAVWALNDASGNNAALGTGQYAGDFSGDVLAREDLRVIGAATRDFSSNNPSPIGPLAYASVNTAGTVTAGTANLSATWNAGNSAYDITIAGESITFSTHVGIVTVVDSSEPRLATINAVNGNFVVTIWDLDSGNIKVQDNFQIVIYDPTATTLNRVMIPDGVDADQYVERTGATLIETQPRIEPVEPFERYGTGVGGSD
tara:strand:- start:106061 stop:107425 length:1365 start_codon:yes stop_codon:yes gene_type:complete